MFRNNVNIFNLILLIILVIWGSIFYQKLDEDLFFDRRKWSYFLSSSMNGEHYQIINFKLYNTDKKSDYRTGIPYFLFNGDISLNYDDLGNEEKQVFPNRIALEWFCYEDQTFYKLDEHLSYYDINEKLKTIKEKAIIIILINSKGEVAIDVTDVETVKKLTNGEQGEIYPILWLKGKKIQQNWEVLKISSTWDEITTFSDYMDFFTMKPKWGMVTNITNGKLSTIFIDNYFNDLIDNEDIENIPPKNNLLPEKIQVHWKEGSKTYSCDFILYNHNAKLLNIYKNMMTKHEHFNFVIQIDRAKKLAAISIQTPDNQQLFKITGSFNQ